MEVREMVESGGTREPFEPRAGLWWRASRYVIEEHKGVRYVAPAPRAKLVSYDLWADEVQRGGRVQGLRPMGPLERLLDLARAYGARKSGWTPATERLLLDWCAKYGLLGLVIENVEQVRTGSFWAPEDPHDDESPLTPVFLEYWQVAGGWQRRRCALSPLRQGSTKKSGHWYDPPVDTTWAALGAEPHAYHSVPDELLKRAYAVRVQEQGEPKGAVAFDPEMWDAGTTIRDKDGRLVSRSLAWAWDKYFSRKPTAAVAYPQPLSDSFWGIYAEPINEFIGVAIRFQVILDALEGKYGEQSHDGALAMLDEHVRGTSLGVERSPDGTYTQKRYHRSLFGALALMVLYNLEDRGRVLKRCEGCLHAFFAYSNKAQYCTDKCKWRTRKRHETKGGSR